MSTLKQERVRFTGMIAELILWVPQHLPGYEVALDEVKRGAAQIAYNVTHGKGIKLSNHAWGLAGDLLLYINGVYQETTEAYRPLGEKWEAMGGVWGGRFGDGDHFSLEYRGVK